MPEELPANLMREGFAVLFAVGGPFMLTLLVVGLLMGLLQAATQINDAAVGFLPRLLAGVLVAYLSGSWAMERLSGFFAAALRGMTGHS
jgi:flagellar biosynthetic protein FliQ